MFNKKISSDMFLLILLVVKINLDSDVGLNNHFQVPETREVFLGSSSAYTQISFHSPYPNVQYPHPKRLELNEHDEATILFNRLNYFNSVRQRRSNLIAYYASSPGVQNAGASIESANAEVPSVSDGGGGPSENPSLPTAADEIPQNCRGTSREVETTTSIINDLSPEDMDLIEILWKQDIDLGVSRDAYDPRTAVEIEKIKDVEYSKEDQLEFYISGDSKNTKDTEPEPKLLPEHNYIIDSETGEFIFDDLSGLSEDEIPETESFDNEPFPTVNCDSYLPFNEDDAQLSNLTDVFPSDLFSEEFTESDFLLSNIDDFEKELATITENDAESESVFTQPEDVFPNLDDCWPDSTTMLPLLALGNSHQNSFVPLSPRPEAVYQNINPPLPVSSNLPNRSTDGFAEILHSSSLEVSSTDETFPTIPSSLGPTSVGCALAESIATLHNDTDPIPTGSLINTVYNPDLPDLLYSNQSLSAPHNELLIHDLFTDDDFTLTMQSEGNQRILNEDHIDSSNDSASLASGRVPSVSDCQRDWADTCSESSSHHEENQTHSFIPISGRGTSFSQNSELYHSTILLKRHRQLESHNSRNTDFREAPFDHTNRSNVPYFSIKSEYSGAYESNAAIPSNQASSKRKFDYSAATSVGTALGSVLQHNHSYHLPFSSSESHCKPVVRDKAKSLLSEEESNNKDEKKARELNIPISIDDIINLAIEEYNERLSKYELTDQQLNLIRDIRRRGKNKVAAQNCRKRKMDQISNLQQDLDALQNEKMQLKSKQTLLLKEKHCIEDKYAQLYQIVSQHTNYKPSASSHSVAGHSSNNQQVTVPSTPDVYMSDDDSDLSRGARTKRKLKK